MNGILKCGGNGCSNSISVPVEQITEESAYLCVHCAPPDTVNAELRFQDYSFDPELTARRDSNEEMEMTVDLEELHSTSAKGGAFSGFQVIIPRKEERETPHWVKSSEGIQKLLLTAFPSLRTKASQRQKAGRWAQVIQLHFKLGWTWSEIADEMNVKPNVVLMIIRGIKYTSEGKTWNGTPRKRVAT